jgi:hypothetical protein
MFYLLNFPVVYQADLVLNVSRYAWIAWRTRWSVEITLSPYERRMRH